VLGFLRGSAVWKTPALGRRFLFVVPHACPRGGVLLLSPLKQGLPLHCGERLLLGMTPGIHALRRYAARLRSFCLFLKQSFRSPAGSGLLFGIAQKVTKKASAQRSVPIRILRIGIPCASRLSRGRLTVHPCTDQPTRAHPCARPCGLFRLILRCSAPRRRGFYSFDRPSLDYAERTSIARFHRKVEAEALDLSS
jgi:hypothetical protein